MGSAASHEHAPYSNRGSPDMFPLHGQIREVPAGTGVPGVQPTPALLPYGPILRLLIHTPRLLSQRADYSADAAVPGCRDDSGLLEPDYVRSHAVMTAAAMTAHSPMRIVTPLQQS